MSRTTMRCGARPLKEIHAGLSCLAVLAMALPACDSLTALVRAPAKIELETDHHDLGDIASDELAESFVSVYNRGKSPLVIGKVTTSCHCTEGEMLVSVIPPGEEGILRVTVNPRKIKGAESTKTLTLFSNDPDMPAIEIDISATVMPGAEWDPEILRLDEIPFGRGAEATVRLRQLRDSSIAFPVATEAETKFFSWKLSEIPDEDRLVADKAEYDIVFRVSPETPPGEYTQGISLFTDLRAGLLQIPVYLTVIPATE